MIRLVTTLFYLHSLLAIALVQTNENPTADSRQIHGPDGQRTRKYVKEWTDDYFTDHKVVYYAFTRTITDLTGDEFEVEIWHGTAMGLDKNDTKVWEGTYRQGKREGEFTTWSSDGIKTGVQNFHQGKSCGKYTQWTADGKKMREETYDRDILDGRARWWNRNGDLVSDGIYRKGQPWSGTFSERVSAAGAGWTVNKYESGKRVGQEKLPGDWWW